MFSGEGRFVGALGRLIKVAPESQHLSLGLCSGFHRQSLKALAQSLEKQIIFLTTFVKSLLATAIQKITGSSVLIILLKSLMNVE